MQFKTFTIFAFLVICSLNSHAQDNAQLYAEGMVNKFSERIFISPSKKDSMLNTFKTYYDDFMIYQKKGPKMREALVLARDTEVSRILTVAQYEEYKIFQDEMKLADARKHKSKEYGRK